MHPAQRGTDYFTAGFRLVLQPGLRLFVLLPLSINLLLFIGLISVAVQQFDLTVADIGKLAMALVDAPTLVVGSSTVHAGRLDQGVRRGGHVPPRRPPRRAARPGRGRARLRTADSGRAWSCGRHATSAASAHHRCSRCGPRGRSPRDASTRFVHGLCRFRWCESSLIIPALPSAHRHHHPQALGSRNTLSEGAEGGAEGGDEAGGAAAGKEGPRYAPQRRMGSFSRIASGQAKRIRPGERAAVSLSLKLARVPGSVRVLPFQASAGT